MTLAKLLILVTGLAVIAHARVALLPGWVVPVPAVFMATAVTLLAAIAAALARKIRADRTPRPDPADRREPAGAAS
jgi:hypothetical protein